MTKQQRFLEERRLREEIVLLRQENEKLKAENEKLKPDEEGKSKKSKELAMVLEEIKAEMQKRGEMLRQLREERWEKERLLENEFDGYVAESVGRLLFLMIDEDSSPYR